MKQLAVISSTVFLAFAVHAQLLFQETFSYPDGALTNVAAGTWSWHSGSGGLLTLNVVGGRAFIDQNDTSTGRDDYNRLLGAAFDPATDNTTRLYAAFTVNFSSLPLNTGTAVDGSYFAHFKSSAANEFYSRIGASTNGAVAGAFRLAIANEAGFSSAAPTYFGQDLSLNTDYLVVARLDLATDQSTLWLNPLAESDPSVTATDTIGYAAGQINAFALRQGTSGSTGAPGDIFLDDLRVGTSFESVIAVPEPSTYALLALGLTAFCFLRRRK